MKFELDAENYHFIIEVTRDKNYLPDGRFDIFDEEDMKENLGDYLSFYQLHFISHPIGGLQTLNHYQAGVLLPIEPGELASELEVIMDQNQYLEHIIHHWELETDKVSNIPEDPKA